MLWGMGRITITELQFRNSQRKRAHRTTRHPDRRPQYLRYTYSQMPTVQ